MPHRDAAIKSEDDPVQDILDRIEHAMNTGGNNRLNLVGQRFGQLLVTEYEGAMQRPPYATLFRCRCDCGGTIVTRGPGLKAGKTRSCGCLAKNTAALNGKTYSRIHGEARPNLTVEYKAWIAMKDRCCNPNCKAFRNYGSRGIAVCERWLKSYPAFLADVGRRPSPQHSIDRINNDGNYEPGNVRWATKNQQNSNRRSKRK
jgi:hypothetical protein